MASGLKEQWEALIVESRFWRRARETPPGNTPVFDKIDQESIEERYFREFQEGGGFRMSTRDLSSMDHPLARFYRLFYTTEFSEFRMETLLKTEGISRGVREMVIDQTFRYFVFVSANPSKAKKFAQIIMALVVYRNMFDESSMTFISHSLRLTNNRLFNTYSTTAFVPLGEIEEGYETFEEGSLKLDFPKTITEMIRGNRTEQTPVDDMLNPRFGDIQMGNVNFQTPLDTSISVFNPHRATILHILHLIALHPRSEPVDLIYVGDMEDFVKTSIRDVIPANFKFIGLPKYSTTQEIMNASSNDPFILVLDQESHLVRGEKPGDDALFLQQIPLLRTLPPTRVVAASLNFRIPSSQNISDNRFRFCGGSILQVPWKNPKDGRMRLVWEPADELFKVYDVRQVYNMRAFQDYVIRPLYKFTPLNLETVDRPFGLIEGEFDSELEKLILSMYYDKFPNGMKSWVEIVDSAELMEKFTILASTRFLAFEKSLGLDTLSDFHKRIVEFHLSDKTNPLFDHALRVKRGGVFPTLNHPQTPLVEAINLLFGTTDELVLSIYNSYGEFLNTQEDLIRTMELKNIFPREASKDNLLPLIRTTTPRFKELIQTEPFIENIHSRLILEDLILGGDRRREFNLIHLGDTLGGIVEYIAYSARASDDLRLGAVYTYGSFDLKSIWNLVSEQKVNFQQIKNIRDIEGLAAKSAFILVEGYGMDETLRVAARDVRRLATYRGTVSQRSGELVVSSPGGGSKFFDAMDLRASARSCLVIGAEYEDMELGLALNPQLQRVHLLAESGAGARRAQEKLDAVRLPAHVHRKIFTHDSLTRNFTPPVEGQRYDLVLCSPCVFSRMFEDRVIIQTFARVLCEELLTPTGEFRSLVIDRGHLDNIFHSSSLTDNKSIRKARVEEFRADVFFPPNFQLDRIPGFSIPFRVNSRQFYMPSDYYEIESLHPNAGVDIRFAAQFYPFSLILITPKLEAGREERPAFEAYRGVAVDVGRRVRETNNFLKRVLIRGVENKEDVLDLACGHGQDLGKWFQPEYKVLTYVGFDASDDAIREARKRYNSQESKPRNFKLGTLDVFSSSSWRLEAEDYVRGRGYSVVSCQLAIHYAFDREHNVRTLMTNISSLLRMSGEFIVTTLDFEEISKRINRTPRHNEHSVVISGEFYRISMTPETAALVRSGGVVPPGTGYTFHQFPQDPMSRETVEYVVDHRYFQTVSEEMGLQIESQSNFLQYARESGDAELMDMAEGLSESERDIVSLYKVFRFRKTRELRDVSRQSTFSLSDFEKRRMDARGQLARGLAADIREFKTGLVLLPEETPVQAYIPNQEYETLHMITESVTAIGDVFDLLRSESKLNDRQRVFVQERALNFKSKISYDYIFLSHGSGADLTPEGIRHLSGMMRDGGEIHGCFVDRSAVERLFGVDDYFANSLFSIETFDEGRRYVFDNGDRETRSRKFLDKPTIETACAEMGLSFEVSTPRFDRDHREFLDLFREFRIRRGPVTRIPAPPAIVPETAVVEEEIPQGSLGEVDRFILVPRPLKKAAGTAAGESIREQSRAAYRRLNADPLWRAKLSDAFEGEPIQMETGEGFKSVATALMYYKCEFESVRKAPVEGYRALNIHSGLPYPENLKPFSKAILGKLGREWKEQEQGVLERIYTSRFTSTRGEDESSLSPLRILLLTRSAQLYSDPKTRNILLEEIRTRIRNVYGNI